MFTHIIRLLSLIFFPETELESRILFLQSGIFILHAQRRHNDVVHTRPRVLSPFVYRDTLVRTAVHLAKYRGKKRVCKMLGEALWDIYGEDLSCHALMSHAHWSVVPVPLSRAKRRRRGYNQSEEIACGFLVHADENVFSLCAAFLARASASSSQTKTVSRRERIRNVARSFTVPNPDDVRGKNILLLDDVMTTGATLTDAARALRSAGAHRVLCITVAH